MNFFPLCTAMVCPRNYGTIVEDGTPEHFFTNPQHDRTKLFLSQIL